MTDPVESLLIDVRANTQGFAADVAAMRSTFDSGLLDGFERAGTVLERGLLSAIRKGSLGFEDLRRIALSVIDQIASQALTNLLGSGGSGGGIASFLNLGGLIGSILGLPGRATGGPVAPGRPFLVGERGPELFVPDVAGTIVPNHALGGGGVEVTINAPGATAETVAMIRREINNAGPRLVEAAALVTTRGMTRARL